MRGQNPVIAIVVVVINHYKTHKLHTLVLRLFEYQIMVSPSLVSKMFSKLREIKQ